MAMDIFSQIQAACSPSRDVALVAAISDGSLDESSERLLKALVVSADPGIRARVLRLLAQSELATFEVTSYSSVKQLGLSVQHSHFDMLICDSPDDGGLPFEFLAQMADRRAVILVSSDASKAQSAFDLGVADYLSNDLSAERFERALARAVALCDMRASIAIESRLESRLLPATNVGGPSIRWIRAMRNGELVAAPLDDILFLQAERKLTRVVLPQADAYLRLGINAVAEQLEGLAFWRINRSTIVNAKYLSAMSRDEFGRVEVHLRGRPEKLLLSKTYERSLFSDGFF